jgi:5-methylcytosine-specific restriction protein B
MQVASDAAWQANNPAPDIDGFRDRFRVIHRILATEGLEYGHRVFYEASRFAAIFAAAGDASRNSSLDVQIMQKVLPRLHGTRKKLEGVLRMLGYFSFAPDTSWDEINRREFDPLSADAAAAALPQSFGKIVRMLNSLRANQFVSFTE